jgi:Tol biopolymer transport system component/DNA-binding winged helix-turn-helix (wHTH) protein
MSKENRRFYEFGPFRIDTTNRQLVREGQVVPLKGKVVDTLLLLIENRGNVVEKGELMEWLWPDTAVEEANLTQNIYMLRKALGEAGYIETIPRRGYRFVAEVEESEPAAADYLVVKERTRTTFSYEEQRNDGVHQLAVGSDARLADPIDVSPRAMLPAGKESRAMLSRYWWAGLLLVIVMIASLVVLWPRHPPIPFANIKLARFTTTGKAIKAAISPDGKYLAHVVDEGGYKSVWLRQVATGKDLQIVSPAHTEFFYGLTFSHDGSYVYYVNQEMNHLGILYRVPALGGNTTKLLEDVDSPVTMSPDDKRFAFVRGSPGEQSITVANIDGTGERKLASTKSTDEVRFGPAWTVPPAWSTDGKTIAVPVAVTSNQETYQTIYILTENGARQPLTSQRWETVGRMEWLSDGNGLLLIAEERGGGPAQIWHVAYPGGATRRITNDLSNYRDLSVTNDGRTLIAVQSERKANIAIASTGDTSRLTQLTNTNFDGLDGMSWTPDGKLVYTLNTGGEENLWLADAMGDTPRQLTSHGGINRQPVVSPDGRYVVFVSNRSSRQHLWRIDIDGQRPFELTHGAEDSNPSFTADGQSVVFQANAFGRTIFRIPIGGGEPIPVTDKTAALPVVSPDGTNVALVYRPPPAGLNQFAIFPVAGGELRMIHELPAHYGRFGWMPDSKAICYADKQEGVGNIWMQPLDGSAPKQLTHWNPGPIFSFAWSRDGKWLAFASGTQMSDVVFITDLAR